jgi:hypothetical protein
MSKISKSKRINFLIIIFKEIKLKLKSLKLMNISLKIKFPKSKIFTKEKINN